ncbi:hypothetical protein FRB96_004822 [Tulasnella sp. 330]|nr:hypothetical protein FRB96_004822 [Tulasnella sp. 330]
MAPTLIATLTHSGTTSRTSGQIRTSGTSDDLEDGIEDKIPVDLGQYDVEKAAAIDPIETLADDSSRPIANEDDYPEGGRGWLVVLGAFIYAGLVLGWPLSWGVFQSYYLKYNTFPGASQTTLSTLGTVQNGIMTIVAFVSGKLGDRYGYKVFVVTGSILSCIGLLSAAFSTTLWQHFITQGLIPGLACGIMFPMIASYPSMWFKRRRALATGIVIGGSSFGGGVASLLTRAMLTKLGLRKTLLVYFAIYAVLFIVAAFLVKSRGPRRRVEKIEWIDRAQFKDPVFWSLAMCMLFTTFGYLPSYIFITTFTLDKVPNISTQLSVAPVAVMNFSSAIGRIAVGLVADRIGVANATFGAIMVSSLAQLVLWNLAEGYAMIMILSVLVGCFGGCFISLLAPVIARIFGTRKLATLSGLLVLFNLPGNFGGPPLAGAILSATGNWHAAITYAGGVQMVGGLCFLYAFLLIPDIRTILLLSKAAKRLIDANESQVYRSAAILHGFLSDDVLSLEEAKGLDSGPHRWLHDVHSWKEFCRRNIILDRNWNGERSNLDKLSAPLAVRALGPDGPAAHRLKIDEVENTVIYTSRRGGLYVISIETGDVLWQLPAGYVRRYAHVEYDNGYIIFDRFGPMEVWRRSADQLNPETALPCKPDPSQLMADLSIWTHDIGEGNAPARQPRRGVYIPFALLQSPAVTRASRFVYPHMLLATMSLGGKAFIWHIPSSTLVETIDIRSPNGAPLELPAGVDPEAVEPEDSECINYVELSDEFVFVCWKNGVTAYRRRPSKDGTTGQLAFNLPMSARSGYPDSTGRRFSSLSFNFSRMVSRDEGQPSRGVTQVVTIPLLPESRRVPMPIDEFSAVHVSPDGRDLAATTDDGWLFYASNFASSVVGSQGGYGSFRIWSPGRTLYLAFDGKRILVVKTTGVMFIPLQDVTRLDASRREVPPVMRLLTWFNPDPVLTDPSTSCAQLTNTAIWLAYHQGTGSHHHRPGRFVTQVDFAGTIYPPSRN